MLPQRMRCFYFGIFTIIIIYNNKVYKRIDNVFCGFTRSHKLYYHYKFNTFVASKVISESLYN